MKNQKKTSGSGTFLLIWIAVSVVLGAIFSAINKTGQSTRDIILCSGFLGFFLAFVIYFIRLCIRTGKIKKNVQGKANMVFPPQIGHEQNNVSINEQVMPLTGAKVILENTQSASAPQWQVSGSTQSQNVHKPVVNVSHQKVPQATKPLQQKKYPQCNCDGCPKQDFCEYGHVVYDEITKERMSLFDKYMMVAMKTSDNSNIDKNSENFGTIATNEERHNRYSLFRLDKNILHNTLNYLQAIKKEYVDFGKCGRAYFNFMKMGDEISLVKEAIREYDAYQVTLKQKELVKLYVLDRVSKEGEFLQEEIYKNFPNMERKNTTNAVREIEKSGLIIREKYGKTYIIRKNNT